MNVLKKSIRLNNGVKIPFLALGTWQIDNDTVVQVVKDAYEVGYRHFDSAVDYQNEEGVGRALRELKVARKNIFITTKVPAHIKSFDETKDVINQSLQKLNLNYIDLLLIHAPAPWNEMNPNRKLYFEENVAVWKAMEEFVKIGKVRAIGISNFNKNDIKNILDHCEIRPTVNQIPSFIGYVETETIKFCHDNDILVEAYSPVATGRLLKSNILIEMAKKYGVSVAQLCIRFDYQLGLLPIPKSVHKEYIKENSEIDFIISRKDMEALLKLNQKDLF